MTVQSFMKRWVMRYIYKPYFYLPWGGNVASQIKIEIKPMSCIWAGGYSPNQMSEIQRQYFYPKYNEWQPTGDIQIYEKYISGFDRKEITLGCNYRLYKYDNEQNKYIAVKPNGKLDIDDTSPLQKDTVTFNLDFGEYYYKEYVAGEGDVLWFDCLKLVILQKADKYQIYPGVIRDYPDEMLASSNPSYFIQYEDQAHQMHETFPEYLKYLDGLKPEKERNGGIFSWEIKHLPRLVRTYVGYKREKEAFSLAKLPEEAPTGHGVSWGITRTYPDPQPGSAQNDKIAANNPYNKIIPELKRVTFMGLDTGARISTTNISNKVYSESKKKLVLPTKTAVINFERGEYVGSIVIAGTSITHYFKDYYEISAPENKANKTIKVNNAVLGSGYIALWQEYQNSDNFSYQEEIGFGNLYRGEQYGFGSIGATSSVPGGHFYVYPGYTVTTNDTYKIDQRFDEPNDHWEIGYMSCDGFDSDPVDYDYEGFLDDSILNFNIKTKPAVGTIVYSLPRMHPEKTELVERIGKGFACAEDCAQFAGWAAKEVTKDGDNPDGFMPASIFSSSAQYRVTIYENDYVDDITKYEFKCYPEVVDMEHPLFPSDSIHDRKSREDYDYFHYEEYPKLEEVKDFTHGCGAAVIISRQSRRAYKQWFQVNEMFETNDNYTIDYDPSLVIDPNAEEEEEE